MNISNSDFGEDCNGELSNIALRYARKQVNEEGLNDDGNCNSVYQCDKNREEVQDSGVIMEAIDYCENKRSRLNSKRKRTENSDSNDKNKDINCGDNICDVSGKNNSINSCSNTKLIGIIGQYLLSRVPLPTTRSDLQKKFTKSESNSSSKKINLDEILSNINDIFKSALGLGIFGLNKNIGTTSNPKYYIVQLNNSKSYLDSIYKYGYINYKHIGELSPYQNEAENFVSPKLCNNFVSFLSFLFGFFSITSYINGNKNENNSESGSDICNEETDQKVEKLNDDGIEISNDYLFELLHEFTGVLLDLGNMTFELNKLFIPKSKSQTFQVQNDESESHVFEDDQKNKFSSVSIVFYLLSRTGYIVPVIRVKDSTEYVFGFKNGPLLKWNRNEIHNIVKFYTKE